MAIGGNFYTLLFVLIRVFVIYLLQRKMISKYKVSEYLTKKLNFEKSLQAFMVSFIIEMYCDFLIVSLINLENFKIFTI